MKTILWHKRDGLIGVKALTIGVRHIGKQRFIAVATCSDLDQFNRKKGRQIVEGRLKTLMDGYHILNVRKGIRGKTDVIQEYKGAGDHTMQYTNATGKVTATIDVPEWMLIDPPPREEGEIHPREKLAREDQ